MALTIPGISDRFWKGHGGIPCILTSPQMQIPGLSFKSPAMAFSRDCPRCISPCRTDFFPVSCAYNHPPLARITCRLPISSSLLGGLHLNVPLRPDPPLPLSGKSPTTSSGQKHLKPCLWASSPSAKGQLGPEPAFSSRVLAGRKVNCPAKGWLPPSRSPTDSSAEVSA